MAQLFPVQVGDRLHGFCGGRFGRDHYSCAIVVAVGPDWAVTRDSRGAAAFATGPNILADLAQYRTDYSYCRDGYDGQECDLDD